MHGVWKHFAKYGFRLVGVLFYGDGKVFQEFVFKAKVVACYCEIGESAYSFRVSCEDFLEKEISRLVITMFVERYGNLVFNKTVGLKDTWAKMTDKK